MDFHKILYSSIFRKSVGKIQLSLKSDKITDTLQEDLSIFTIIIRLVLLRMRNLSEKSCRKNQKKLLMYSTFFF
jgi:hypothetical protein